MATRFAIPLASPILDTSVRFFYPNSIQEVHVYYCNKAWLDRLASRSTQELWHCIEFVLGNCLTKPPSNANAYPTTIRHLSLFFVTRSNEGEITSRTYRSAQFL